MPIISSLTTGVVYDAGDVATPQVIDNDLGVGDGEQDWSGGSFVVSGLLAGDTVSIDTTGNFTIVAGDLFYAGNQIGTVSGGVGGNLVVTFTTVFANDNAVIEELLEALRFSSTVPLIVTRDLTYTLSDGALNTDVETVTIGITGDADDNHLKGTGNVDTIDGFGGNDLLRGEGDNDALNGGSGNDNLVGGLGDDTLSGGDDNDTLNGGLGADDMTGDNGNDTYYVDDAGDDVVEASGEGTDTVRASIDYTLGDDVENLFLSGAADEGHGNVGNNTITGNTLADSLYGDAGDDTLNGQGGNDVLYGDAGLDTLNGGTGDDYMNGGDDNDILRGGAGNDTLNGELGGDDMDGGVGNDIYYVDDAGDVVGETVANGGTDLVYSLVNFTLSANIENISLMGGDDINATGNTLANSITGNTGENVLDGGGGADTLNGGDDDDTLVGGAGNDSLTGGAGDDDMSGGIGDDTYYVDSNGDVITENSGEGTDTAYASLDYALGAGVYVENLRANAAFGLVLDGNELDNRIYGGGFDDTLEGFGGNDRLDGGLGEDIMIGGLGDDIYYVDDQDDEVIEFGGEGTDTVRVTLANYYADDNVELIYGLSNLGQRLGGNSLDNRVEGADGDDILAGGDGDDILLGGLGADRLNGNAGDDSLRGGGGNDIYFVDADDVIIENANEGVDTIYTVVDWTIDDNVENLIMLGGDDDLVAGGNALNNVITGNAGWNDLYGDDGDDTLNGGGGDDYLFGEADDDILNGGAGDDLLDGGEGADTMNGAQGDDQYIVDDLGDVTLDTGGGIDMVIASVSHTIGAGIEVLYLESLAGNINGTGNSGNNLIWGNEGDNVLSGLGGHDALTGDEGEDLLYGGDGDDFLDDGFDDDVDYMYGGNGRDQLVGSVGDFLYGGVGNDEYSITEDGINIIEYDAEGYDTVFSQITYTLTDFVERLDLSCAGGDIDGTGNAQANTILGNCHANVLDGAGANDVLYGGDGDDTLIGGLGNDRMSGEDGSDTFVVRNADIVSSVLGQTRQADIILDLDFDDGDRIDLSDVDADINTGGDQDFVFVSAFTKHAGEAKLSYNSSNDTTLLQLDVDGDGKVDYQVSLYGDHTGGTVLDGSEPAGTGGWVGFMTVT